MITSLLANKRVILVDPSEPFHRPIDTALGIAAGLDQTLNPMLSSNPKVRQVHWVIFGYVEGIPRPSFAIIQHVERQVERTDLPIEVTVPSLTWSSYDEPIWTTEEFDESFLLHMSAVCVDVLVINNLRNAISTELRNQSMLNKIVHQLGDWATLNNALVIVAG